MKDGEQYFSGIGIDPGIIVIVLAILTLISFIASVICFRSIEVVSQI